MITLTESATEKVSEFMNQAEGDCIGLRVAARVLGRHTFNYDLTLVMDGEAGNGDVTVDAGPFTVFVDPSSAEHLEGTTIDFVSDLHGAGFKIDNPNAVVSWDDPLAQKVQEVLDHQVAPALAGHGGWIELVKVEGDAAHVAFGGGCQGCGMSEVTLKQGIESAVTQAVPEIKQVVDATDHAAGTNPYCCS
jgi:Fe/S biogenesis protein NfuA